MGAPLMDEMYRPRHTEAQLVEIIKGLTDGWATRNLVRRAIRDGKIRPHRVGHRSLYTDQDAVEFVQSLKVAPDINSTEPQTV